MNTRKSKKIAYLTPIFTPAVGGAVAYLEHLSTLLVERTGVDFLLLTEKFPGSPATECHNSGKLCIKRIYPFRAGRAVKDLWSYISYLWQNILFLGLPYFIYRNKVNIFIVHGSFLNNPTILWLVLRIYRFLSPETKLVADLRDPKLPLRKLKKLRLFDSVISCSRNISERLMNDEQLSSKVCDIPIIVDVNPPDSEDVTNVKLSYGVNDKLYIFNGSGVSREKRIERLVEVTAEVRKTGINVLLVVVGKRRFWSEGLENAKQEGWFYYLGQVTHQEALALAAGSWIDVNLSSVDSVPRHSLEALMSGAKVLLPKGVPEFETECIDHVAQEESPKEISYRLIQIAEGLIGKCEYNVNKHSCDHVISFYEKALEL